jgi:murein DD-endopeptidase MepM/ murein hydrolase activator NlpD
MKDSKRPAYSWLVYAAAAGFIAGMVVMAALFTIFPSTESWTRAEPASAPGLTVPVPDRSASVPAPEASPVEALRPSAKETPAAVSPPPIPSTDTVPSMSADPVAMLKSRQLELPVKGAKRDDLRNMFDEERGGGRRHEAIDMLAARNTPVIAVEDGTIARLFLSDAGGITIYQFDPTSSFCYYYAHLQGYADGVKEGDRVKRGDVIGYVGTTGNAPKDTPHLHFAIFQLTDKKQWWQGTPVDPYKVLR